VANSVVGTNLVLVVGQQEEYLLVVVGNFATDMAQKDHSCHNYPQHPHFLHSHHPKECYAHPRHHLERMVEVYNPDDAY
jgi:hypothetical protein